MGHKRHREEKVNNKLNPKPQNKFTSKVDPKQNTKKLLEKILDETERFSNLTEPEKKTDNKNYTVDEKTDKNKQSVNSKPESLSRFTMDAEGRVIDAMGNIITKQSHKSTLMININKEKEKKVKEILKAQKIDQKEAKKRDLIFYDPNLELIKKNRNKVKNNAFNFIEQGTLEKKLENVKIKQAAKQLGLDLSATHLTEEEEKDLLKPDILTRHKTKQPLKLRAIDLVPDVEWWDLPLLPKGKKSFSPYWQKDENGHDIYRPASEIKFEDFKLKEGDYLKDPISIYIQHPVPIKNDYIEKTSKVNLPVFLTKHERKRIRRIRRTEKEKDKQEKMKLGLLKPPEPKLKFNNFMRIIGDSAIQDPSQAERKVRKAYAERFATMMKDNESRKLTDEQKAEKVKRKFDRDSKKEVRACLFKIEDMTDRRKRFKVHTMSQQLYLTGQCLIAKKSLGGKFPSLVYVEGGPLAIKKYKNLLLRRIKWDKNITQNTENADNNINPLEYRNTSKCALVWEGVLKTRQYDKWKINEFRSETDAKKFLNEKGVGHYWNLILSFKYEDNL
jgi:U4/U6 small nuclear ribonucleoprotein PRP3